MRGGPHRYTDCRPTRPTPARHRGQDLPMDVPRRISSRASRRTACSNGIFNDAFHIGTVPEGHRRRLADAITEQPGLVARRLGTTIDWKQDAFDDLNTAFVEGRWHVQATNNLRGT